MGVAKGVGAGLVAVIVILRTCASPGRIHIVVHKTILMLGIRKLKIIKRFTASAAVTSQTKVVFGLRISFCQLNVSIDYHKYDSIDLYCLFCSALHVRSIQT